MNLLQLKAILKEKGVSGKELAEKTEVSPQTISNIIKGSSFPKPELLLKISEVLNVDIRELFISTQESEREKIYVRRNGEYVNIGELKINEK